MTSGGALISDRDRRDGMAVTIKQKTKSKQKATTKADELETLVDQIGERQDELVKLMGGKTFSRARALEDDITGLQAKFIERADAVMAKDEEREVKGITHMAKIGMKAIKREITDLTIVRKFMGDEAFFKVAKLNLKDADDYLNPEQKAKCIKSDRIGARKFAVKAV